MIKEARTKVAKAVADRLTCIGYISNKRQRDVWGSGTVQNLSDFLRKTEPKSKGFSSQNLWRMNQFFEMYHKNEEFSLLVREIGWTNNIFIIQK